MASVTNIRYAWGQFGHFFRKTWQDLRTILAEYYRVLQNKTECKIVQDGARWCKMVQEGSNWCKMVQDGPR